MAVQNLGFTPLALRRNADEEFRRILASGAQGGGPRIIGASGGGGGGGNGLAQGLSSIGSMLSNFAEQRKAAEKEAAAQAEKQAMGDALTRANMAYTGGVKEWRNPDTEKVDPETGQRIQGTGDVMVPGMAPGVDAMMYEAGKNPSLAPTVMKARLEMAAKDKSDRSIPVADRLDWLASNNLMGHPVLRALAELPDGGAQFSKAAGEMMKPQDEGKGPFESPRWALDVITRAANGEKVDQTQLGLAVSEYEAPQVRVDPVTQQPFTYTPRLPDGIRQRLGLSGAGVSDGGVEIQPVAVPGSTGQTAKDVSDLKTATVALDRTGQALDAYANSIADGAALFNQGRARGLKRNYRALQLELKELFNLGVLTGPDLTLMEEVLLDPTSLKGAALEQFDPNVFQNDVQYLRDKLNAARATAQRLYGGTKAQPGSTPPAQRPGESQSGRDSGRPVQAGGANAQGGITDALLDRLREVESSNGARLESEKGARGPYQFLPETWEKPGFGIPGQPAHTIMEEEPSRLMAGQYLEAMRERYGNLSDALAAYNWGPGNVDTWIAAGRPETGDKAMPKETRNYLQKFSQFLPQQGGAPSVDYSGMSDDEFDALLMQTQREILNGRY